jgi:hypothetical protein
LLAATFPWHSILRWRIGIVQPVGSILLLGLLAETICFQLPNFRTRRDEFLREFLIPLDGIRVPTLPITDVTTKFRYFAAQTRDLLPQLSHETLQVVITTDIRFQQHGIHDAAQ